MARTGIYFSDVKKARDGLLAKGRRPSIDAIRAALGDTGSKSTIHKYLRELEAEEGVQAAPVSDTIQALIVQLADQLKAEAGVEIDRIRAQMTDLRAQHEVKTAAQDAQLQVADAASRALSDQLSAAQAELAALTEQFHREQIARHTADQHAIDLDGRLADAQRHQASLEEKHRHARDALEHYRSAAKEQRDQDTRRHEQQVQGVQAELRQAQRTLAVKQEELTRLNKEAAALASELAANKEALYREKETVRNMTWKVAQLPVAEARIAVLENQLGESRAQVLANEEIVARLEAASASAQALYTEVSQQKAVLEAELASAKQTSMLEDRLARLDDAVFGSRKTQRVTPGK